MEEKQIELIGSAATLVYERLLKEFPSAIDPQLAHFFKAPIVLDSYFFEPSLKESKWTEKDQHVYNQLVDIQGKIYLETDKEQFERLFNAITDEEMNLKLGFANLLVKDFKTYYLLDQGTRGIGVGTIHVPIKVMEDAFSLEHMKEAIKTLLSERSLAYYGILTNCRERDSGEYRKEVLLFTPNPSKDRFTDFVKHLDSHEGFKLSNR